MNNALKVLVAGLGLTALSAQAETDPLSFNYGQLGYTTIQFEGDDASAISAAVSQSFGDVNYVFADADFGETDENEIDYQRVSAGLGVHLLKNESTTSPTKVFLAASYEQYSFELGGAKVDDEGFGLKLGFRTMAWEHVELFGSGGLKKFDDSENYFISGGIGVKFIDNLGVYLDYTYDDLSFDAAPNTEANINRYSLAVRGIW